MHTLQKESLSVCFSLPEPPEGLWIRLRSIRASGMVILRIERTESVKILNWCTHCTAMRNVKVLINGTLSDVICHQEVSYVLKGIILLQRETWKNDCDANKQEYHKEKNNSNLPTLILFMSNSR